MAQARALKIHPDDNVAVLLSPAIAAGTRVVVDGREFLTDQAIPSGHKIALRSFAPGEPVTKYGQLIARATAPIAPGAWLHTHNASTTLGENEAYEWREQEAGSREQIPDLQSRSDLRAPAEERGHPDAQFIGWNAERAPAEVRGPQTPVSTGGPTTDRNALAEGRTEDAPTPNTQYPTPNTFSGFVRADGRVGVRNELWVLCTVGCINRRAEEVARRAHQTLAVERGLVDGVYAFTHPYGCAQIGGDLLQTRKAIAALAAHPNCGGVLLMGLGCENNALLDQVAALRVADPGRIRYFSAQECDDEVDEGLRQLTGLAEKASGDTRTTVPLSKLVLGMKCGGSDGFSGLTANPLVGVLSDRLAAAGGVSVLTEVPEMFGAERLLMQRAIDRATFDDIGRLINDFKDYFRRYNEPISENPAPGNKAGGITTLEEKSLGCIQKGGVTAPISHVLDYGEPLPPNPTPGIALAYGPGSDVVSCTTLAMTGAPILLFTTGRGTPFGTCVPTMKLSTNSDLAHRKPDWIDFDAGRLVEDGVPLETLADELLALVVRIASGERQTRSEINNCREIALFKDGVIN